MDGGNEQVRTLIIGVDVPGGAVSPVELYRPAAEPVDREAPMVMFWPGFGMGAYYYRPIARALAGRGYRVALGELRGQGRSTARASRRSRWGYHDLAAEDYPRSIRAAKHHLGLSDDHPTVLLTHSMGGQIGALFLARAAATELGVIGMFGVGSGSPYLPAFAPAMRRRLRMGTVVLGGGGRVLGYWPGRIGGYDPVGYGRQSGQHMMEWRRLALRNSFQGLRDADIDYPAAMREVRMPVLLTMFADDADCPPASSRALAEHLPNADLAVEVLPGELGHNRWARQPGIVTGRFERFVDAVQRR